MFQDRLCFESGTLANGRLSKSLGKTLVNRTPKLPSERLLFFYVINIHKKQKIDKRDKLKQSYRKSKIF